VCKNCIWVQWSLCGSDNEIYNPGIELNTVHLYQHYTFGPYCAGLWVIMDNINHHKQNNFKQDHNTA